MNKSTIFERLIEARRDAGLPTTQASIAKELGISPAAVSTWKRGYHVMTMPHALALAYSAGVNVEWLLSGRGQRYAKDESSSIAELLRIYRDLPEGTQKEILEFAKFRSGSD